MPFPANKTKIVCTIGPASDSVDVLEKMIRAGMNVARLNFSHGDFKSHGEAIQKIRQASSAAQRRVAIMADLPGPKIRIGEFEKEPIKLNLDDPFTLTVEEIIGNQRRVSVSFKPLPKAVKPRDRLFLNDGLVELEVIKVEGLDPERNRCGTLRRQSDQRSGRGVYHPCQGEPDSGDGYSPGQLEWAYIAVRRDYGRCVGNNGCSAFASGKSHRSARFVAMARDGTRESFRSPRRNSASRRHRIVYGWG